MLMIGVYPAGLMFGERLGEGCVRFSVVMSDPWFASFVVTT